MAYPYQSYQPYQNQAYSQYQNMTSPQSIQASGPIWVQGEAGAKSYLVAPNCTVPLWDSEAQVIYLKSADASGMPSMKIIDYTIREQFQPKAAVTDQPKVDFATHEELKALEEKLMSKLDDMKEDIGA